MVRAKTEKTAESKDGDQKNGSLLLESRFLKDTEMSFTQ